MANRSNDRKFDQDFFKHMVNATLVIFAILLVTAWFVGSKVVQCQKAKPIALMCEDTPAARDAMYQRLNNDNTTPFAVVRDEREVAEMSHFYVTRGFDVIFYQPSLKYFSDPVTVLTEKGVTK